MNNAEDNESKAGQMAGLLILDVLAVHLGVQLTDQNIGLRVEID